MMNKFNNNAGETRSERLLRLARESNHSIEEPLNVLSLDQPEMYQHNDVIQLISDHALEEDSTTTEEPVNILNLDHPEMYQPNYVIQLISDHALEEDRTTTLEIPVIDFFVQGRLHGQEITSYTDDENYYLSSDDSKQDQNYVPESETSDSDGEQTLSDNGEKADENNPAAGGTYCDTEDNDNTGKLTRKRLRNPEKWKRSIAKKKRNEGSEYINASNKLVKKRQVQSPCSNKCRLNCRNRLTQEQREKINKNFWKIGDIHHQRDYFLQCMDPINPKYRMNTPNSNRSKNFAYHFELEGKKIRVCKSMYLKTLDISSKLIFTATHKKDASGILQPDLRGKHTNGSRKVNEEMKRDIRSHIKSFPTIPSHYCRADTNKQYIDGSLNIASMYRLYNARCDELGKPFAKQSMYETIFSTEFNIAFYIPKKDQCMTCESFKNSTGAEKDLKQPSYDHHIKEKTLCRQEKENDLEVAKLDNNKQVVCFDLQAVLSVPCGDVSGFYYKRRLATFNFTIYDVVGKQGFCFTWHEALGKRGANEIGSCLYIFLKNHTNSANITLYSDNCARQNKNKFVVSMLLHCVNLIKRIEEITYKFLVVGHTQNEGDSMHALIEREKKRCLRSGPIYTPQQLIPIIKLEKRVAILINVLRWIIRISLI